LPSLAASRRSQKASASVIVETRTQLQDRFGAFLTPELLGPFGALDLFQERPMKLLVVPVIYV
jgi:hypothetical protein